MSVMPNCAIVDESKSPLSWAAIVEGVPSKSKSRSDPDVGTKGCDTTGGGAAGGGAPNAPKAASSDEDSSDEEGSSTGSGSFAVPKAPNAASKSGAVEGAVRTDNAGACIVGSASKGPPKPPKLLSSTIGGGVTADGIVETGAIMGCGSCVGCKLATAASDTVGGLSRVCMSPAFASESCAGKPRASAVA